MPSMPTSSLAPYPRRLLLLGHPVAHSLSPRFQNAALEAAGAVPPPIEVELVAELEREPGAKVKLVKSARTTLPAS